MFSYIAVVFVCLLFFTKAFCSDSLNACMYSNTSIHFSPVGMIATLSPHLVSECMLILVITDAFLFCLYVGPMHSQLETLSDSWARLKHNRDWLCNSSNSFESDFDLTKSLGVHTLIENVVSFVSGDVGNAPGFKEPEESMSTSPQASIIAMEQQQLRAEVSLWYLLLVRDCGNLNWTTEGTIVGKTFPFLLFLASPFPSLELFDVAILTKAAW